MIDQASAIENYRKSLHRWNMRIGGRVIVSPTEADSREIFDPMVVEDGYEMVSDVFDDSNIDLERRTEFLNSTNLLHHRRLQDFPAPDDFVTLLPPRVYGYAMLNRKWFPLNINLIEDIPTNRTQSTGVGFDDLVLPPGHKKLLQALIKNQVRIPQSMHGAQKYGTEQFSMDVVKGKGKGLIILLHGVPGVGKTSTAECVAEQLRRPLLPLTCGDISTSVHAAEATLQAYCGLAHRWRCVLLLDEADVFLAKREKGDLQRNALVSGKFGIHSRFGLVRKLKHPYLSLLASARVLFWGHYSHDKPCRGV